MKVALLIVAACILSTVGAVAEPPPPKAQIMIVGVAHLVAKRDLHNATWGESSLAPTMQQQIRDVIAHIAAFKPTKVMIETLPENPIFVQRYKAYVAGKYVLDGNEDAQFGYRLAALAGNPTIYPIDAQSGFPFDYAAVQASAKRHGQEAILAAADAHVAPFIAATNALERQDRLVELLRYLNTPKALAMNASWYAYVDRIGDAPTDYAGADLVSFWYARNLHIFANMLQVIRPGDRVVLFIGQGHAARLRPLVELSPDLQLIDPEPYLK